jgi:REP element-mobilizing transposase RayT
MHLNQFLTICSDKHTDHHFLEQTLVFEGLICYSQIKVEGIAMEFPFLHKMPSMRTRSTFYSTAGNVSREIIEQYIEKQSKT